MDGQEQARISVFQGENDDARYNDLVGEFMLEGLADVASGNEILVRFELDLDGILKVTAVERATGRQRQLTVENAVSRARGRGETAGADSPGAALAAALHAEPAQPELA